MASSPEKPTSDSDSDSATRGSRWSRLAALPARLARWARSGRLQMSLVGGGSLFFAVIVFALWSYIAQLAVGPTTLVHIEDALAAYDAGDLELAKKLIGDLQDEPAYADLLGSALFVLGAIKASEADAEYSEARRRATHLAASRYLQKAHTLGFPEGRQLEGTFMLGRSLVLGNQLEAGVEALEECLDAPEAPIVEIHSLLVQAQLDSPMPDLRAALEHNDKVLQNSGTSVRRLRQAQFRQVIILLRLGRIDAARATLGRFDAALKESSEVQVLLGRLNYLEAAARTDPDERRAGLQAAIDRLRKTMQDLPPSDPLTRRAMFWIARALQARGDAEAANQEYDQIHRQFGDTSEGIAATLARAEYELAKGRADRALLLYRYVLEAVGDPLTYVNPLLSINDLRKAVLSGHQRLLSEQRFEESLELVEHLSQTFSKAEQIEFLAGTNRRWGEALLELAEEEERFLREETLRDARLKMRTAARAYEDLARLRFATRLFTTDLWNAGEAYFAGQSFSSTARIFEEYLRHEARWQNSMALLRLGQSRLALGEPSGAMDALLECIEMYPRDAVVYTARIEAARAARLLGDAERAEEFLRTNLTGDALNPRSPEWRDSLFELGQMLYEQGRYEGAIEALIEAVERYPSAEQSLLAQYTIARSLHNLGDQTVQTTPQTKTELEKQKKRRVASEYLQRAYEAYLAVQRMITLHGDTDSDPLQRTILRNCYMMQGSVLYDLNRFEDARQAYANVSGLYQNEPVGLESFVKIADCWRRLNQPTKARGAIEQAKLALDRLPKDLDFQIATNFSRQQWTTLLDQMSTW